MMTYQERRLYFKKQLIAIALFLAVCFVLLCFIGFITYKGTLAKVNDGDVKYDPSMIAALDDSDMKYSAAEKIEDSLSRPLFNSTRLPIDVIDDPSLDNPEEAVPEVEGKPFEAEVTSIIMTDEVEMALVRVEKNKTVRLEKGMSYNGWMLNEINPDSVLFKAGNEVKTLQLRKFALPIKNSTYTLGQQKKEDNKNDKKK